MENASNALMMAGGVLIGILLLSVLVVAFSGAADLAKSYDDSLSTTSLQAFNNNFEQYTLAPVNIQSIITMTHFAKDYNAKNGLVKGDSIYISVVCEREELEEKTDEELIQFMQDNTFVINDQGNEDRTQFQEFTCKSIEYNEGTGTVTKITLEKI